LSSKKFSLLDFSEMQTKQLTFFNCIVLLIKFQLFLSIAFLAIIFSYTVFTNILRSMLCAFILSFSIFTFLFFLYIKSTMNKYLVFNTKFRKGKVSLIHVFWIIMIVIGMYLITSSTLFRITSYLPDFIPSFSDTNNEVVYSQLFLNLYSIFIASIAEEIVYRRIMLEGLSQKYNMKTALIISTLIFAISHFSVQQSINVIPIGFILGFIYLKTSSLKLCVIAHSSYNLLCAISEKWSYLKFNYIEYSGMLLLGIIIIVISLNNFTVITTRKTIECNS